jgi:hypothetical protein
MVRQREWLRLVEARAARWVGEADVHGITRESGCGCGCGHCGGRGRRMCRSLGGRGCGRGCGHHCWHPCRRGGGGHCDGRGWLTAAGREADWRGCAVRCMRGCCRREARRLPQGVAKQHRHHHKSDPHRAWGCAAWANSRTVVLHCVAVTRRASRSHGEYLCVENDSANSRKLT